MEDSGRSIASGVRTSSRAKVKSQRALESEDTNRLLAIAKARARAEADGSAADASYTSAGAALSASVTAAEASTAEEGSKGRKKATSQKGRKGSRKTRKEDVYCLCKSPESDRPMIECGHCNDWFHFDCIDLQPGQAETIHTYICPTCTSPDDPSLKTTYTYDLSNFRSPTPPSGLPPTPVKRKKPLRKSGPKSKSKTAHKRAGSAAEAGQSTHNDASGSEAEASSSASSSSGDDSDEADASAASDSGSDASSSRSAKRPKVRTKKPPVGTRSRPSVDGSEFTRTKRSPAETARPTDPGRRPSGPSKRLSVSGSNAKSGTLPAARQFVLDKLIALAQAFFDGMTASDAKAFAVGLESSLFANFKEVKDGKVVPAAKYKTQFNLLTSSLNSSLRTDVRDRILSRDLPPSSVATLSSAELASQDRYLEMEKARLEVLQQTVRQKGDGEDVAIRMGRDGVERAEDRREIEMERTMRLEEEQRERARRQEEETRVAAEQGESKAREAAQARRESTSIVPPSPINSQAVHRSPAGAATTSSVSLDRKASSNRVEIGASPSRPTFNMTSAWGGPDTTMAQGPSATPVDEDELMLPLGGDQSILDLSDLIALDPETETDQAVVDEAGDDEPMQLDESEWEKFERGPVVWSGGLVVPYSPAPAVPTACVRVIASAQPQGVSWKELLPRDPLAFTARLSSAAALKFLSDCRLDPSKEMYAVAFTLKPGSSQEEKKGWTYIVEDHLKRDRYMSYRPDGEDPQNPRLKPRREVYLIPLRPADPSPDITGLIDGYAMPAERKESVFLALYVLNRGAFGSKSRDSSVAVPPPPPSAAAPPSGSTTPIVPPPPQVAVPAPPAAPVIQNDQLQALLGKLNPTALQGIVASPLPETSSVGGLSPVPGGAPYQPGPQGPPPPGQYGAYPPYGQDDRSYMGGGDPQGRPTDHAYGQAHPGGNQHGRQGSWDRGHPGPGHPGEYQNPRQGPYDNRRDDRGDWGRGRGSGWSDRRGRGH